MSRFASCLVAGLLLTIFTDALRAAPPDQATQRALDDQTQVEFVDTPLAEAMQQLAQKHNVPIAIDEQGLTDVGIPTEEPISLVVDGVTLQSALGLLCNGLGLEAIPNDGGGLLITTSEIAEERVDKRRYDLRPISALVAPDPQKIIDVVKQCTDGQWADIDGIGGTVQGEGTTLVVEQTSRIHNQIAELLVRLQRIVNPRRAPQPSQREKNEQALYRVMQKEIDVEFVDTPLIDVIDELAKQADASVLVDVVALTELGVPTDEPVNLPSQQQPLVQTLQQVLQPLDLTWRIDNEAIVVTTRQEGEDRRQVGLFDVRRQVHSPGDAEKLVARIQGTEGTGPWEQIDGIGGTAEVLGGVLIVFQHREALEKIAESLK